MKGKYIFAILSFLLPFLGYLATLAPTISWGDSGELISVGYTLGIAHPPGYPLYTLLAKLCTLLPIKTIAWRINFLSAFSGAVSTFVFYLICKFLFTCSVKNNIEKDLQAALFHLFAFSATLLFAFSHTFWRQVTVTEVYALATIFHLVLLYLLINWYEAESVQEHNIFLLFSLLLGLALGHHYLTTILIIPTIYLVWKKQKKRKYFNFIRLFSAFVMFILGLSIYLYLPIRAAQYPFINWVNPQHWRNFLEMIAGAHFKLRMFSTTAGLGMESVTLYFSRLLTNINNFLRLFWIQFAGASLSKVGFQSFYFTIMLNLLLLVLALVGAVKLYKQKKEFFWSLLIFGLSTILVAINYQILDIEPYYIPVYLSFIFFVGNGLKEAILTLKTHIPKLFILPVALPCLFSFIPFLLNYRTLAPRKEDFYAYFYAKNIVETVEDNALIVTFGDNDIFPLWYWLFVEKVKPNVIVFGSNFLTSPWYKVFFQNPKFNKPLSVRFSKTIYPSYEKWIEDLEKYLIKPNIGKMPIYLTAYDKTLSKKFFLTPIGNFLPDRPFIEDNFFLPLGDLFKLLNEEPDYRLSDFNRKYSIANFNNRIELIDCFPSSNSTLTLAKGETLTIKFIWRLVNYVSEDYTALLFLTDLEDKIYTIDNFPIFHIRFKPIYDGLFPTSRWRVGETYLEEKKIMVPLKLPEGEYVANLSLLNKNGLRIGNTKLFKISVKSRLK